MTSCLGSEELQELIRPMARRLPGAETEAPIGQVVLEILNCAQSFVPCEAGSLMLSHPDQPDALVFVASFGVGADKLPGTVLPPGKGIAGKVYRSGLPHLTNRPSEENTFYQEIDKLTEHRTNSLLCVPLRVFGESVGVLSLLNRKGGAFEEKDLNLITIFSDYLTQSFQLMIEARKQREAALRDHLTGLFNDRYLYDYLAQAIRQSLQNEEDLGLIFLDLDHFKSVVDSQGHLVGSQALREIGALIREVAESHDSVAARYGGDEYVVVVPAARCREVTAVAEALRIRIEEAVLVCEGEDGLGPVTVEGEITASVGVVCLRQLDDLSSRTIESVRQMLLRVADEAMYKAKAGGKNRVHWHQP